MIAVAQIVAASLMLASAFYFVQAWRSMRRAEKAFNRAEERYNMEVIKARMSA